MTPYLKSIETHTRAFSRLISDGISGVHSYAKKYILHMAIWQDSALAKFINKKLKTCKIDQLLFVSVSFIKGKFEGTSYFFSENPGLILFTHFHFRTG